MARTSRLPEYQAFIDATEELKKDNVAFVKYDKYVIVKRDVWETKVDNVQKMLNERAKAEQAIYSNTNVN